MKHLLNLARMANPAFWYFLVGMIGCGSLFIYLGGVGRIADYLTVVFTFVTGR